MRGSALAHVRSGYFRAQRSKACTREPHLRSADEGGLLRRARPNASGSETGEPLRFKVTIVEDGVQSQLELERTLVRVGRAVDNDIRLASKLVSRHHCRIEADAGAPFLVDLGSANGTALSGQSVQRALIESGAWISVGDARLRFEYGEELEPKVGAHPLETQEIQAGPASASSGLGSVGLATQSDAALRERENLRVFARIVRALVSETELEALLRLIVDSAIALAGAERGFLLLAGPDEGAGWQVRVARSFDKSDLSVPAARLSGGIARAVLGQARPVLSLDAAQDERFAGMASVEDLRLRSVMGLPIEVEGRVQGVLYLDNRLQRGAFTEEDLDLVELFAGQASIAIRNARLVEELRDQNRRLSDSRAQIERLNEQLGRKVRDRDMELSVVRAELGRERGRYDYSAIVASSAPMRRVFQQLDRIIESDLPVLIQGESGTGKELIARAIHFNGRRRERPFVSESCAALPDALLESELFGHTRGAFTGADRPKKGLIEQASGGTLFLDEIGDMSPEMQKKLLRVLQEGVVRPLGSDSAIKVDLRLLAASHRKLEELVARGEFREDLFYRVHVLGVQLPPLRERVEDIPLLAEALLARAAREAARPAPFLPVEVLAALTDYRWPGNVRELENEMRRLVVLAGEHVQLEHLSEAIRAPRDGARGLSGPVLAPGGDLRRAVRDFERAAIEAALAEAGGNKSRAAARLCISRFALQRKLEKYQLAAAGSGDEGDESGESDEARETDDADEGDERESAAPRPVGRNPDEPERDEREPGTARAPHAPLLRRDRAV